VAKVGAVFPEDLAGWLMLILFGLVPWTELAGEVDLVIGVGRGVGGSARCPLAPVDCSALARS
jgi:hypothetical protein